ncbi:MAG: hypothetical protein DRQ10_01520, partial [Candidatus Hydrothermota bacterium]
MFRRISLLSLFALIVSFELWAGVPGQKYMSKEQLDKLTPEQIGKGATIGQKGVQDRKMGIHQGNKIRIKMFNFGPLGGPDRVDPCPRLEWPAYSGHEYIYEVAPLIGAKVRAYNPTTGDSVWIPIVDDPVQDGGDEDFEPLPGYANPLQDTFAFSTRPQTWPDVWPPFVTVFGDTIYDLPGGTDGYWPGAFTRKTRFGDVDSVIPVTVADEESYFVMTDEGNIEFLPGNPYGNPEYDPGNGLHGIGIQVEFRGYQWAALPVEDVIILSYKVTNISNKTLDTVVVGMFGDFRIGGPGSDFNDDRYTFDRENNMVISFDNDGYGRGADGQPYLCGMLAFKFLESPGIDDDGIDNDGDGMVDESMYDMIDNDHDWDSTSGFWRDDVGRDGIAGTGDEGEGNQVPDWGEPNFDMMDVDEKDELGLTSAMFFAYGSYFAAQDNEMWALMTPDSFADSVPMGDYITVFGSGYFSLEPGESQRYSIALIMGEDWDDLYDNAAKAQEIYNMNYQFPRPPETPTVYARAGDGQVTLYWDDAAERSANFEGYAIYRSEDRGVNWGDPITDAYGRVVYWEPIAQFDLVDSVFGLAQVDVNGARFYLGDDTGLQHSWTDTTVVNGKHYWYVVTAYSKENVTLELPPLQTAFTIDNNPSAVEVIPNAPAIGYIPPEVEFLDTLSNRIGTGEVQPCVLVYDDIKDGHVYRVTFNTDAEITYNVDDITDPENPVNLISQNRYIHGEDAGPIFDGIRLIITNDSLLPDTAYWTSRTSTTFEPVVDFAPRAMPYPADYEIEFGTPGDTLGWVYYSGALVPSYFRVWRIVGDERVEDTAWFFSDKDSLGRTPGDTIINFPGEGGDVLFLVNPETHFPSWKVYFEVPAGEDTVPPGPGEVIYIHIKKPFSEKDTIVFMAHGATTSESDIKSNLDKIAVVPNPYIVAAEWELKDPSIRFGRGAREIHFINLPP